MRLMLDSGAFGAWTRGQKISVREYARYIKSKEGTFELVASLDVIPGTRGRRSTIEQVGIAASQSFANYEQLTKLGCEVMPVYHYGEYPGWLIKMLNAQQEGTTQVGLGALVGVSRKERRIWLTETFNAIGLHAANTGDVRVHGFGMTDFELMFEYPWDSVDSSSWLIDAAMGLVYIPAASNNIHRVYFSNEAASKKKPKWGMGDLGPAQTKFIEDWLQSLGLSIKAVCASYKARRLANVRCIQHVMKRLPNLTFYYGMSTITNELALNESGEQCRLLSFNVLRNYKQFDPTNYRTSWNRKS